MKTTLIVIAAYLLLLFDLSATYTTKNYQYKLQYYGLLWVTLDYWSIKKYESKDVPKKWLTISSSKTTK
jgi:hypothetical protein